MAVVKKKRTYGDLDGNMFADVLMTVTDTTHPAFGSTGAWLIGGKTLPQTVSWLDVSTLGTNSSLFGMGRTYTNDSTRINSDIFVEVKSGNEKVIGAWVLDNTGKVSSWKTIETFGETTQVLGLGDFNGNGETDLLLRSTREDGTDVGCYFTSGTKPGWNYFQSLGNEWKICAVGDFNNDGRSDIVLKHDAGFAGCWLTKEDGTVEWSDLDTLAEGFTIVGAGDFNGDGTDDVLLKNGDYYGAWLVEDGNAKTWMGFGTFGGTVEQIADFNNDGVDDLRIRTEAGDIGAQLVMGEDNLSWSYYGSVGSEWSTSLAALL